MSIRAAWASPSPATTENVGLLAPQLSLLQPTGLPLESKASSDGFCTRFVGGETVFDTVKVTPAEVVLFPAASRATAATVWLPLLNVVVSSENWYGVAVSSAPTWVPSMMRRT